MVKKLLSLLVFLVPAVLSAMEVSSDFDRDVSLASIRTFAFADQSMRHPMDALSANELAEKHVRRAIGDSFEVVGLDQSNVRPDVLVYYYATVGKTRRIVTNGYARPAWWGPRSAWVEQETEGTAIVDLVDARSGELIWRGRVSGAITLGNADQRTQKAMQKLAAAFEKDRAKQEKKRAGR